MLLGFIFLCHQLYEPECVCAIVCEHNMLWLVMRVKLVSNSKFGFHFQTLCTEWIQWFVAIINNIDFITRRARSEINLWHTSQKNIFLGKQWKWMPMWKCTKPQVLATLLTHFWWFKRKFDKFMHRISYVTVSMRTNYNMCKHIFLMPLDYRLNWIGFAIFSTNFRSGP